MITAALGGELTEAQTQQLYALGTEAVTLAFVSASRRIAALKFTADALATSPSTPSGMEPLYAKSNKSKKGSGGRTPNHWMRSRIAANNSRGTATSAI